MARKHFARSSGPRRQMSWLDLTPVSVTQTGVGGTLTHTLNAAALALRPFTVVRTIMEFQLGSDQAAAIENQVAAYGMAVVSDQALAVGVSAVLTPVTDAGSDLFFFHKFILGDESKLTDRSTSATRVSVESRAMRKVDEDSDLALCAEFSSAGGGWILTFAGRMLIKLH